MQLDLLPLTSNTLDSTLQHMADQSAQCFLDRHQVTAGILKLLRQNSHLDQTLVTFLWWVQVSSFYKPSWDSKRQSAMPRIIQPFSSRTRSGLQYFSPNVISAACSFPFVLQSNLWGMCPCLHSIISYFLQRTEFQISLSCVADLASLPSSQLSSSSTLCMGTELRSYLM